jgi:hypothetical protein
VRIHSRIDEARGFLAKEIVVGTSQFSLGVAE